MNLYLALKAAHVLAVLLWVGGMAFVIFFLRPALAVLEPPQRLRLMHEVMRRFLGAVLAALLVVLFSGLALLHLFAGQLQQAGAAVSWPWDWWLMVTVGLLMSAIFLVIRFLMFPVFSRAVANANWPAAAAALAKIRRWVAINLVLGVAVVGVVLAF